MLRSLVSGDSVAVYGVEYPAASPKVIAVGGTTLAKSPANARGWVESVWGSAAAGQRRLGGCLRRRVSGLL